MIGLVFFAGYIAYIVALAVMYPVNLEAVGDQLEAEIEEVTE